MINGGGNVNVQYDAGGCLLSQTCKSMNVISGISRTCKAYKQPWSCHLGVLPARLRAGKSHNCRNCGYSRRVSTSGRVNIPAARPRSTWKRVRGLWPFHIPQFLACAHGKSLECVAQFKHDWLDFGRDVGPAAPTCRLTITKGVKEER